MDDGFDSAILKRTGSSLTSLERRTNERARRAAGASARPRRARAEREREQHVDALHLFITEQGKIIYLYLINSGH